jgi:hypothetical protein
MGMNSLIVNHDENGCAAWSKRTGIDPLSTHKQQLYIFHGRELRDHDFPR